MSNSLHPEVPSVLSSPGLSRGPIVPDARLLELVASWVAGINPAMTDFKQSSNVELIAPLV